MGSPGTDFGPYAGKYGPIVDSLRNSAVTVNEVMAQQSRIDRDQQLKIAQIMGQDPGLNRAPEYLLNFFNVSPRSFVICRPPEFPRIVLQGCPEGEPWWPVLRLPNVVWYKTVSAETGQVGLNSLAGERVACDIINPANLSNDMWRKISGEFYAMHGEGDDLSIRGVFWSKNVEPNDHELSTARLWMEQHYRKVVERADRMARDPKEAPYIGEEAHIAADYLKINATWHVHSTIQAGCPICGEMVNQGIAAHKSAALGGKICVLDWRRAVSAGIVTKNQVPDELRWWKE